MLVERRTRQGAVANSLLANGQSETDEAEPGTWQPVYQIDSLNAKYA